MSARNIRASVRDRLAFTVRLERNLLRREYRLDQCGRIF